MKKREGFVSNSSSSSFVIISAGEDVILVDGDTDSGYDAEVVVVSIDDIIEKLMEAKESGATTIHITHGGGYDG